MKIRQEDILTPANAVSMVGLVLTLLGAAHIAEVKGVILLALGRLLDVVDGFVARHTHASPFGAAIDGTFDKLGVAALIIQGLRHHIAPAWLLLIIAGFNIINVIATLFVQSRKNQIKTSRSGKHAMFTQNMVIAGFALATALNGNSVIEWLSTVIFIISLPVALQASFGYAKDASSLRPTKR